MTKIYNTISDPNYFKELVQGYENESLNQWQLYTQLGCLNYYNAKNKYYDKNDMFSNEDFIEFGKKKCFSKNTKTLFISLGCGNSETEKLILKNLGDDYNIDYLGVDSSEEMLKISIENLGDLKNKKSFIRADFSSEEFLLEIDKLSGKYEKRIFAFFGGTFGNMKHTKIINILYNILSEGEKIWIDVYTRKGRTLKDDFEIHEIYRKFLKNPEKVNFLCDKLNEDGIDTNNSGELILETRKIDEIEALIFTFSFVFNKRCKINIRHDKITFLPESQIELLKIYRFDVDGFTDFFSEYGFQLIDKQIKGYRGQFLFGKSGLRKD